MSGNYVNRYTSFIINNNSVSVPFVKLPTKGTDRFDTYKIGKSRLDKISEDNYGVPYYGWLILVANPELGGSEWNIPDNTLLRVPYPLDPSLKDYATAIQIQINYYG